MKCLLSITLQRLNASSIKTRIETPLQFFHCNFSTAVLTPLPLKQGLKHTVKWVRLKKNFVLTPLPLKQGLKPVGILRKVPCGRCLNASSIKTRIETRKAFIPMATIHGS